MIEVGRTLVSGAEFRAACSLFPTGVTVVTRRLADGRPYGMTVSSFTSVSLEPPLILICIDKRAGFLPHLETGLSFAVNVLSEAQQQVAVRFSRAPETGRFEDVNWSEGIDGVPLVEGAVAVFLCSLTRTVEAGDHVILIGAVQQVLRRSGLPLVWCGSGYHCLPAVEKPESS